MQHVRLLSGVEHENNALKQFSRGFSICGNTSFYQRHTDDTTQSGSIQLRERLRVDHSPHNQIQLLDPMQTAW